MNVCKELVVWKGKVTTLANRDQLPEKEVRRLYGISDSEYECVFLETFFDGREAEKVRQVLTGERKLTNLCGDLGYGTYYFNLMHDVHHAILKTMKYYVVIGTDDKYTSWSVHDDLSKARERRDAMLDRPMPQEHIVVRTVGALEVWEYEKGWYANE